MATTKTTTKSFKKGSPVRFTRRNGETAKGTYLGLDETGKSGAWAKVKVDYKTDPALVRLSELR